MIDSIFTYLSEAMYNSFWLALLASFGWGVLSMLLSPCHLSSIPLIVGFINSQGEITLWRTFKISLVFALGILITIGLIGIITASLGRLMGDVGAIGNYLVALVFFIVGLNLLDILKLPWDFNLIRNTKHKGLFAALILGLLFGVGLGPCTFAFMAPVLGVVFETAQSSFLKASLLLLAFSVGHCSVIITAGMMTKKVQSYLNWTENTKAVVWIRRICGILVILGGIYLLFNNY
ncbi:MAG: cytochrome c-type bioproteinis protein [Stygiobacter sp.]|nr:MAG: cytochrome c-type bioproteinis protein [Stygiobacter sp.]KAF0216588.1 MAG: cytochrome c-type bioproteinis [Ignavibacteria bacterium]